MSARTAYVGRFAPSPTGPLHAGSIVAALASWLDARAHHGRWLVRIEDIDKPREQPGAAESILDTLRQLGLVWDDSPSWQSQRLEAYGAALKSLVSKGLAYPCACTRSEIADSQQRSVATGASSQAVRGVERPYPGTCRNGLAPGRTARSWRIRLPDQAIVQFDDRWQGWQQQDVATEVGDFVLQRADGLFAYQLAVVVDDGAQGITDVIRGADLLGSTARQRLLGRALGLADLRYLHVPVVLAADGEKLSKQNGAIAVDIRHPVEVLDRAFRHLGFGRSAESSLDGWLADATRRWAEFRSA
jgi:glutamyl-Q tRNA(Asp) synthetase